MRIVATHRLAPGEAGAGAVALHPDLEALLDAVEGEGFEEVPLAGGKGRVRFDHDGDDERCVAVGPPGWLGPAPAPGDLVALRWDGGELHVDRDPEVAPSSGAAVAGALRAALDGLLAEPAVEEDDRDEFPVEPLEDVVSAAVDAHPEAFAVAAPPLSELLVEAGLEVHDSWVGRAGVDWEAWDDSVDHGDLVDPMLARAYGLDAHSAEAVAIALGAIELLARDDDPGEPEPDLVGALLEPSWGIAEAVVNMARDRLPADAVDRFFGLAARARNAPARAAGLWGRSTVAEQRGDVAAQEQLLTSALTADGSFGPALEDLSWFASDRGDASRAVSLLARGGAAHDDRWRRRLESFAAPGPLARGRNEPCGCGSGRKYKACCSAVNGWPLDRRLPWLYDKAVAFLHRPVNRATHRAVLEAFARSVAGDDDGDRFSEAFVSALNDGLLMDLTLFEGGVLAAFAAARGPLLPSDELAVLPTWLGRPRSLCEVTAVTPGEGLELRDVVTGWSGFVVERAASRSLQPGLRVLSHLLPGVDGGLGLYGGVVEVTDRAFPDLLGMLDRDRPASAEELAGWWGAQQRPPRLANTDGEELVLGQAVLSIPAELEGEVDERLAVLFEDDGDGAFTLLSPDGKRTVHASLQVADGRVSVSANSSSRMDMAVAYVQAALPGAELLDRNESPMTPTTVGRLAGLGPEPSSPDPSSPELAAVLEQVVRGFEERWCDESVPALGGLTPREALETPVARDDLLRLLDDMARQEGPGSMSTARVRGMLGLDG